MTATVWVVAGCLFEVSLPVQGETQWTWSNPGPEVTLLADQIRPGRHHFRFRAEAPGARAGTVHLRFHDRRAGGPEASAVVHIAPEHLVG